MIPESLSRIKTYKRIMLRTIFHIIRSLPHSVRLVASTVPVRHFSSFPSKSRPHIVADLLRWRIQTGSLNEDFFLFGLDRIHRGDVSDYVSLTQLRAARDRANGISSEGMAAANRILEDKALFANDFGLRGHLVAPVIATLHGGIIRWVDGRMEDLSGLWSDGIELDVFCKPVKGGKGRGVFPLVLRAGEVTVDGRAADMTELEDRLSEPYVMQERIIQHPSIAELYPSSLNTMRLLTFRSNAGVTPLAGCLRLGRRGSRVDNFDAGGLLVGIDLGAGCLDAPAFSKHGDASLFRHPDTGVEFDKYPIPHFSAAVQAACRLHEDIPAAYSVGWDVAITEDGPIIVEGNARHGLMVLAWFAPKRIREYVASSEAFATMQPEVRDGRAARKLAAHAPLA